MRKNSIKQIIQNLKRYGQHTDVYESHNLIKKHKIGDLSVLEESNFIGNHCDIESIEIIYNWKTRENK